MTAPQASSRLEMLQARFQQKQLQEKEQKLLQLYDQQQQRAYQVVQRGSAGSNASNHGSTSRTTATTTTHTTSTSQGGKVRQMFDERRQTTVKGIDRSYPLEPLENKSRKQTNANGFATQRNGKSMVNRQSVNVKRATRADVNSNVKGGKPVVSYHEEIMRESFGPSVIERRHDDEDEFVENRVAAFANGYYRHEADNEPEEVLDRETVENNRMMAKIHLMGFDESLKHQVRNDLENEEFPEYLMVDVPDRIPKRNVTKKLTQAEARLERFKNANAKRSNMSKQLTSTSNAIKKRLQQTTNSNSRRSEIAGTSPTSTRSGSRVSDRRQRILENVKNFLPAEARTIDKISRSRRESSDIEIFNRRNNSPSFSKKPIKAEDTSIYSRKALNGFKSLTADGKIFIRHSARPQFFCKESERSGTTMSIDRKSDSSGSSLFHQTTKPQFLCKESERSATTMSIDRKSDSSQSPLLYQETLTKQSKSPPFFLSESEQSRTTSESKSPIWDMGVSLKQSTSPQYLFRKSKRSETAMSSDREIEAVKIDRGILKKRSNFDKNLQTSLDRKTSFKSSPSYGREIFEKRNTSPQFFCKESERSATTMSLDRKSDSSESPLFHQETLTKRGKSPHFFLSESERSRTTSESKSPLWEREISSRRSTSPFRYEFKRSETTTGADREITGSKSSEWNKEILTKRGTTNFNRKFRISDTSLNQNTSSKSPLYEGEILKKRNTSPGFFCKESERSGTTVSIDSIVDKSRSPSHDREEATKRGASPRFFCKESERSGTTMSIDHKISKSRSPSYNQKILKHSATPQLSSRKIQQRSGAIGNIDRHYDGSKSSGTIYEKRKKRTASPQFFCKESEKSATTMLIEPRSSSTDSTKNILKQRSHTPDISYKQSTKPLSPVNKINFSQDRVRSPSIIKHETKKVSKNNEVFSIVTESRRSSKISETSATSTSSIVSLKYGLEFDNILQSAGLVSKFMKSQNGKQHKTHQSSPKRVKNGSTLIAKDNQSRNRYKTSLSFRKASSLSIENRKRPTPESPRKSITPTEVDMEIQEIVMTDHRIERDKLQKATSPMSKRQIDGACTKSFNDKAKLKASITYPVRKMQKQRASILKSNVFKSREDSLGRSKKSTKNYRTYRDSGESAISLSKLDCSPANKTSRHVITRPKEDENRAGKVKTSQIQERTWNKSVRNQAERTAFRSKKPEDRQYTAPRSLKRTLDRSTKTHTSKASPDSSGEGKYSHDVVSHLCDSKEQSVGTRAELDQLRSLQSARLVQDTLKEKNLSASEYHRKRIENENKNVAVDEVDAGIDVKYQTIVGIALNGEIKDYRDITRSNFANQSIDKDIVPREKRASTISNTSRATKKECGSRHDIKSRISPRVPSFRKTVKISPSTDAPKILASRRVASRMNKNSTRSKFFTNTIKDHKDRNIPIAKKSANLFNRENVRCIEKSEHATGGFSKMLMQENEKNFERMDPVESALRRFDSTGAEFEPFGPTSSRASPEISLQMMDMRAKSSVKQTVAPKGSTLIPSPEVIDNNVVLKSTPKSPVNKDRKVKNYLHKSDLKISGNEICSIKRLEKRIGNTTHNKKSTQTQSPICKRRLFVSDSEREIRELNYAKTRRKENYSPVSFRFRKDKTISRVRSSEDRDRGEARESKRLQDLPMLSVKPLRSIEDIRKSIDNEQNKIVTAKESRSAIANRSVSRQDVDARRSISATDAAKNVFLGDNPARLTKAKSCVSRITKSPSPDSATRKHHETSARATRGSVPSSPSKSPDIASKNASIEPKNQEAKPLRKSAVAKGTDSTGSKAATIEVVDTIDGVALQNGLLHESTTKKSDAFIIDFDDQSAKEGDIASKKSPMKKSSGNKQQRVSSASDRPISVSSNSSASLTHGQVSSTKSKMATRAKAPASGGPQAKGSFSPRSTGTSADNLVSCKTCGRTFAEDRIGYHEKICVKVVNMKRKKFDAMTFRIKGTELEPFAKKGLTKKQEAKKPQVKSDWRRKHEDFINTIRSAKQLQAHVAAGGNLRDFPPPPPSDTSDYIQCPHCNRKFNQAAAERHIPKCETMLHNKPARLRASRPRR